MRNLLDSTFGLLLATRERPLDEPSRALLAAASEQDWQHALDQLGPHKVFPLLAHQLRASGLWDVVPASVQSALREVHEEVRRQNALLMLTLARVLRLLQQRGEQVTLLKGILLADSYYPDFSTRPMADMDLLAVRGRDQALFQLLEEAGFRPSFLHPVQEHGITYLNRQGVFLDAHRSLPMFDHQPWHLVRREIELQRVRGVKALSLEPNAMVAHLVRHMHSHAHELGVVLLWVVDLAFTVRRHAHELDLARIRALCADEQAWALFLRLSRTIASAGEPLPADLKKATRALPALSLRTALRQRRLMPWGLPGLMGWARVVAHRTGLHVSQNKPPLSTADLVLWPLDTLRARMAPPLARVAGPRASISASRQRSRASTR